MEEVYSFGVNPVTTHAWNKTRQQLAFTPNNQEVHLYHYEKSSNDWTQLDVLDGHDLKVTGIDWAPNTNRIVTCSADRNAYVWTQSNEDKKWKPTLVLLRINRAATCVKWSPLENKFAAGSGARLISVCYFESENDWWVAKHIKKPIKSTITCLDWHPNNHLLACGSTDFKIQVFSAYIKDIEAAPQSTNWGSKSTLGNCLAEMNNSSHGGGWVHSVAFSKDGNKLCWTSHDGSINVADVTQGSPVVTKLNTDSLPFLTCLWVSNSYIVAAGHSCCPILYSVNGNQIQFVAKLDLAQKKESAGISAMKKFKSLDRQARVEVNDTELDTIHQNAITSMRSYSESNDSVSCISTSGLDGRLVLWNLKSLESSIQGLRIS